MNIVIKKPNEISNVELKQLLDLISTGAQVEKKGLQERLLKSELIAYLIIEKDIISTATLKNPAISYRNKVFKAAGQSNVKEQYSRELGYIVTNPSYEGKKLCQRLLQEFVPLTELYRVFATTRKPSMAHILTKFGFKRFGKTYKKDLNLFLTGL